MSENESFKSLLKEALQELKAEITEELRGDLAVVETAKSEFEVNEATGPAIDRDNPPQFDPTKPRAVWRKIRCAEPPSGGAVLPVPGETQMASAAMDGDDAICGRVYNRILQFHDNPHPVDLKATSDFCPKCGGTKWEELARFKSHGPKSPNVTILKSRKND